MLMGRSFTYNKNGRGPKTDPWGTPILTFSHWDLCFVLLLLKITVHWWRFSKYNLIRKFDLFEKLNVVSFFSTVSNFIYSLQFQDCLVVSSNITQTKFAKSSGLLLDEQCKQATYRQKQLLTMHCLNHTSVIVEWYGAEPQHPKPTWCELLYIKKEQ